MTALALPADPQPNDVALLGGRAYRYIDSVWRRDPVNDTGTSRSVLEENALAGDSGWWKTDEFDTLLLGFSTTRSVTAGDDLDFKLHTDGDPATLDIYRLGWYGGDGAKLVASLDIDGATQGQGTLRTNGVGGTGSRRCTNWTVTDTWTVPDDATHGVYLPVLKGDTGDDSTWMYLRPVIVRNARYDNAPLAVLLSDMTWEAYNHYGTLSDPNGGKSLYGARGGVFNQAIRAWDVSHQRPLIVLPTGDDVGDGTTSFRAYTPQTSWGNGELGYWMWLERNGIEWAPISMFDLDADPSLLEGRTVISAAGHNEYWSQNCRDAWDAALASGASGFVASGNSMLWRTQMTDDLMACYKDSHTLDGFGSGTTPDGGWTGTWRDTRWAGRRGETESLGVAFVSNGVRNDRPTVPYAYRLSEMWRDTQAEALGSGQELNLKVGALGMEWDTFYPGYANTLRYPPRLRLLAETVVDLTDNRADENGSIYTDDDAALAWHPVAWPTGVGAAFVVNVGMTQWAWGLGLHCRGTGGEDLNMQQATANCLVDMGISIPAPMTGLTAPTPTEWSWPTIVSVELNDNAVNLAPAATDQLALTATWSNGLVTDVTHLAAWSTDDAAAATVSDTAPTKGLVTAAAEGDATITATFMSQSDTCDVTVAEGDPPSGHLTVWTNPSHSPAKTTPTTVPDTDNYELGTSVTVSGTVVAVGIKVWNPGVRTFPGSRLSRLWNQGSGLEIAGGAMDALLPAGWSEWLFVSPVNLVAGQTYWISYDVSGASGQDDYGFVANGLNPDVSVTEGGVTVTLAQGGWHADVGSTPWTNVSDGFYGIDLLFELP